MTVAMGRVVFVAVAAAVAASTILVLASTTPAAAREREPYPQFPGKLATAAAVHTAARLAHALRDPLTAESLDIPPDLIDDARRACVEAAAGPLPEASRVEAVECAYDLGASVTSFLADDSPALRAVAAALVGARARASLTALAADPAPEVAATALGLLCADDAARTVRDLDAAGRARIAALVRDGGSSKVIDPGLAAHVALCLPARSR